MQEEKFKIIGKLIPLSGTVILLLKSIWHCSSNTSMFKGGISEYKELE